MFFRLAAAFKVIPVSFANFAILFALVFCGCREGPASAVLFVLVFCGCWEGPEMCLKFLFVLPSNCTTRAALMVSCSHLHVSTLVAASEACLTPRNPCSPSC